MDRRQFLKWGSFVTVSVATTGLAACGGSDDAPPTNADTGGGTQQPQGFTFRHGVASGDPKPDSVMLWTRVEGDNGGKPVDVTLQVSATQDFASLIVNDVHQAQPDWDYTLRTKVSNLTAATTYYYRYLVNGVTSMTGRTRTAPAAGTPVSQLKFAFMTCQDWSVNHWAGMAELAAMPDLDFVVHMGDYIYETVGADFQTGKVEAAHPQLKLPNGTRLADNSVYATTLDDYRYLYKTYRTDPRLQAVHAAFPVISIWDDHEFSDDCWQDHQTYTPTDDQTEQVGRRRSANQAWFEFMPADVSLDLTNPSFQNIQIYRKFEFGDLATLVMTDERLYRADHVIPEAAAGGEIGSRYFVAKATLDAAAAQKQSAAGGAITPVSMLGDTQRQWWKDQMSGATTKWKLWGNEVSLLRMKVDGTASVIQSITDSLLAAGGNTGNATLEGLVKTAVTADLAVGKTNPAYPTLAWTNLGNLLVNVLGALDQNEFDQEWAPALDKALPAVNLLDNFILNADMWDGYNAERNDLMNHLKTEGIGNVVALTGDIHSFFAGVVMDDHDATTPTPVMVDLVSAGMSSNSFWSFLKEVVDFNPAFAAVRSLVYTTPVSAVVNTLNDTLKKNNPATLHYADTDAQGYAIVTLTPAKLSCTFHKMARVDASGAAPVTATASTQTVEVAADVAPAITLV
ncbi:MULTISPECIES: alkaline phosphatase D family protein [unclassified Cupriavidus]|uniref:alkaline phosphatase D family protein n=1 Tax=Cupriavidus sp. H19C3 TaxID=3241603 RepID=UPI003BF88E9D